MEIGDKVRYIGGQIDPRQKPSRFTLKKKVYYTVARMQPEYFTELGLCMAIGLKEDCYPIKTMFRTDLFVVIPVMKEQDMRKHYNYCTEQERQNYGRKSDGSR